MRTRRSCTALELPKKELSKGAGALRLPEFLPYRLAVVARAISHELGARYAREFGISVPEWRVIAHLGEVERCSSGEICARTEMDKAKVNRAVTRLAAAGLVLTDISKIDKRLNVLTLSAKGRAVLTAIAPIALGLQKQLANSLTQSEREGLIRIVNKLHRAISEIRQKRIEDTASGGRHVSVQARRRKVKSGATP